MPRATVESVQEFDRHGATVSFDCAIERERQSTLEGQQDDGNEVAEGRTIPVTLRFYNPTTFRFEIHVNPESNGTASPLEFDEEAVTDDVELDVRETDEEFVVDSGELTVRVGREPWTFVVENADGTTLFEEQREDYNAKLDRRVEPLGFTEEEVNRWLLNVSRTSTAFKFAPDEHIFGVGEKFTDFDKRGQQINAWVTQPNGSETEDAYKNVPFYLSSRGYGLLVDTINRVEFDFGNTSSVSGEITVEDDSFAFVFFGDSSFKRILEEYTALTGRPHRPPKWSFGVWMSKYGYRNQEELEAVTARLREEEIPCDVIHLDPYWMRPEHPCDLEWDAEQFPDPAGMIDDLHENEFHLCLWEHPYVAVGTEAFKTARDNGYLVADPTGDPYVLDRLSISTYRGGIVDFTNPEAARWWQEKHYDLLDAGVDVFKTDFGEYLPRDAILSNGKSGEAMRNYYPHLYLETVYEAMVEKRGLDETILWSRPGWIGSQRFPVHWPGDPYTSFESMGAVLRGGLSLMLSGYAFWSHDIGGFKGRPSTDLYVRDTQFGLLNSHSRYHGTTVREPWHYGETAVEVVKKFAALRYSLVPYLYSYAELASRTGLPVMRPLVLEYQDDPSTYDCGTQYLLGEELLVAPVFNDENRAAVYLPEDEWIDHWSGERYEGGRTLRMDVPIDEIPLFVRAESVVPRREPTQTIQEGTPERVTLEVTFSAEGSSEASFEFYDEDADRMIDLAARMGAERATVEFDVGAREGIFEAEVRDVESAPEEVTLNGRALERVAVDPAAGEWAHDADANVLRANFDE